MADEDGPGRASFGEDPHSYSRPTDATVRHLSLDLTVDFDTRRLAGTVRLELERPTGSDADLVLDTWRLEILAASLDDGTPVPFELGDHDALLGSPLTLRLGDAAAVVVYYRTHPDARALQWLEPAQTTSGKRFLFTQSQAISARSWVPLQDTPTVRFSYDATLRVPADLLALMSAQNPTERTADGRYRFTMTQPVPAYLMALAIGDLEFRSLGPRSGVYAEPSVVDDAAEEFADTEAMLAAAERLYGPYRWERYDLMVAPPSFPFGGMENPRLTFLTPTLLAGDRSLVSVVAHELAHSWSGNLVTNATWSDFWLNEGFTTYIETRLVEEIYGPAYAEMLLLLNRGDLEADVATVEPRDTWLEVDLAGRDPDAGISTIAYDKGSLFLRMLEHAVGRERFDAFLTTYFDTFAFRSISTPQFLEYLRAHLLEPAGLTPEDVALERWVHGPGVPDNAPVWTSAAFDAVDAQVRRLLAGGPVHDLRTEGWTTYEWIHLVRALPRDIDPDLLSDLDDTFGLSSTTNNEVLFEWLQYAIDAGHVARSSRAADAVHDFLTRQGRRKYLMPVYEKLAATEAGKARAEQIYDEARPGYHPASARAVDQVLGRL